VSKLMSEVAGKAGLIKPGTVMSAMALKNSGINLGNLLATIEAGKARKEAAELARQTKADKELARLDEKKQDNVFKLRRNLTEGNIGKMYNNVNTAARTANILEEFAKNP